MLAFGSISTKIDLNYKISKAKFIEYDNRYFYIQSIDYVYILISL